MFAGQNIVVVDLETQRSAQGCRHCNQPEQEHYADGACQPWHGSKPSDSIGQFSPLGWNDPAALGLSIGCYWDYHDSRLHWFDVFTLEATMRQFVQRQVALVSFNGIGFDFPLMHGLLLCSADSLVMDSPMGLDEHRAQPLRTLCDDFAALCGRSYDLLAAIWQADPARKFERGLNSLDALSQANGYGAKEMDGATAARRWAQGRYADVIGYNVGDVLKTKALFEQICAAGVLLRGDGLPLAVRPWPGAGAPEEDGMPEAPWTSYRRKGYAEMRPYVPGEDLGAVSVSPGDTPAAGGMIARNPQDHADQWYVAAPYFAANFEPA